ncbi:MAG: bifunctional diaminohydroxyphosphoribosylaminopyrimidine deaminase/5-amino-6-(5-phosphoribosylamino)uracil reductase RibD [candidate division WOR-3 bacterium]
MTGERFMDEALALAREGRGRVAPNPMVGAVLVKASRIVGRGAHRRFGGPHAEVEAIANAGRAAKGATLFVTMEPCCHQGKTPACTDALHQAGVRQVVVAMLDPNPVVHGKGVKCLRAAGISVEVGLRREQARRLNEAYVAFMEEHRPFVVLKVAVTLDGMMAAEDGESQWITGPKAREYVQELRREADAILVGVNTVLKDNPRLTCRVAEGKRLLRVVLDSRLRFPQKCRLLEDEGPVLVFTAHASERRMRELAKTGVEVVRVRMQAEDRINWQDVLSELYRRQVTSLLIEGGATVVSSALEAGVVDKACFLHAPKVLGPGKSLSHAMTSRRLKAALVLRDVRHQELGEDMLTEGYVYRFG